MPLPDTSVKLFSSGMAGAPVLSGTAGTLIAVLDACLVTGFGTVPLASLSVTDNIATAVVSAGHGFPLVGGVVGSVIQIEGATPAALNGQWRVATVPNSTTFTFATTGISNISATGTITAKRAAAGWEKRYSGTNKAGYRSSSVDANGFCLSVDDTLAEWPTLVGYESMETDGAGAGRFPLTGTDLFHKSAGGAVTAREWRVFADHRACYLFSRTDGTNWFGRMMFGDLIPFSSPDVFCSLLMSHASTGGENGFPIVNGTGGPGQVMPRAYNGLGGAISARKYSHRATDFLGGGVATYPNPAGNQIVLAQVDVWESAANVARGILPGCWNPLHTLGSIPDATVIADALGPGRGVFLQRLWYQSSSNYAAAFDLMGPWR